jgi:hypothetical protein
MNVENWHPVQLVLFWLLSAVFGLPIWLGLALLGDWLASRYPPQDWFQYIPIGLAFLVVFGVVGIGLTVTWKWMDQRESPTSK